jgi:outer membrane protein TolC
MVDLALVRRGDYLAAKELQESKLILTRAAIDDLKPRLDVRFNLGYAGLKEGSSASYFAASAGNHIPGASVSALLTFEHPIGNAAAQGRLAEIKSECEKAGIAANELARVVASNIAVAFSNYRNSKKELIKTRESSRYFRKALENEKEMVRLGAATFLDLLDVEERLTDALLDEIAANLKYAGALARCRFETGTMIAGNEDRPAVRMDHLVTLPVVRQGPNQ